MVEPDRSRDNIIRRVRFACWITNATDKHTQNKYYLLLFHGNKYFANAPQYYVNTNMACLVILNYKHSLQYFILV